MPRTDADPRTNSVRGGARQMGLGALLRPCGVAVAADVAETVVSSIEYDSRRVEPGCLFVAIRGFVTDGHAFIEKACRAGAAAVLVEETTGAAAIPEIVVPDTRECLGLVAHEFYGRPSERLETHGITGTNGKTTTTYLLDSIFREAGRKTGVVGTLGYRLGDRVMVGDRTSPESLDLARLLASMVEAEVEVVTMEVSSHALKLSRAAGMQFDTATFTNLSRDHLDFHGSLEEYARAKRILFDLLEGGGGKDGAAAIVNGDDPFGSELVSMLRSSGRVEVLTYGMGECDVTAGDLSTTPSGTTARFHTPAGDIDVRLALISAFNVMNALAATAVAVSRGVPLDAIAAGLARVEKVEGRLELVDAGQDFTIVVDYAHTPDALGQVLGALAQLPAGKIITVFGCGGDRDRGKRPMMGEIAVRNSDVVIVTSDNPRTEDPAQIIEEILAGTEDVPAGSVRPGVVLEANESRREAIRRAVELARRGDIVLIAGKGHEDYQILGDRKIHFDDREEAREAVRTLCRAAGSNGEGSAH
jgi:UDP-N-acetylmuramoyl-L-alanyl-D-glutamate--2,6-diaminopimelate ligase